VAKERAREWDIRLVILGVMLGILGQATYDVLQIIIGFYTPTFSAPWNSNLVMMNKTIAGLGATFLLYMIWKASKPRNQ